ncbi:MAG: selenium metabolism-associated LysR family transcriptional regulator [Nitrospirota bacterium]
MEDHKLRVFCTVAETRSFSKASEIIHLTQPAVSLQIQALEDTYETKLFDRSSSTVTLTPSGEILYKYAKEILTLYAQAEKDIGELTGLVKGSISIGASTTIGNYVLPSVLSDFKRKNPKIKIHLLVGNTRRVVELLNAGNLDLGLVEGEATKYKIITEKFLSDELTLIVPSMHPWAKRKEVSMLDIIKEPLIFREEGSGTRQVIEQHLSKRGIGTQNMNITTILGSTEAIKQAVEDGTGISIVSKWAVRRENRYGTIKPVKFKEGRMLRDFSLVFNKNTVTSYAVDEFLNFLRNYSFDRLLE